jgi:hypothetical protein
MYKRIGYPFGTRVLAAHKPHFERPDPPAPNHLDKPTPKTMSIMVTSTKANSKGSNSWAQKIYRPLGFNKGYNFALWFIFGGAMFGFCLARFMYLNFDQNFCPSTPPGECYYFLNFDRYKIGILLHLAGVLPAGILAVMQFTPYIRHRWIMVHRISGYFAILLYTISLIGALMIARHSFGGGLDVQAWIGFVGIGVLVCFIISYINIKRLQIEQHRAWMLRGWFYVSCLASYLPITSVTLVRPVPSSPAASS